MARLAALRAARRVGVTALVAAAGAGAVGNAEGQATRLVADLGTTPIGSRPFPLVRLNGLVLFGADSVEHGRELFASDGTSAETRLLKDLRPGGYSGLSVYTPDDALSLFTLLGPESGPLFFGADDGVHGTELWMSDGTEAGTRLVKDINPGPGSSNPRNAFIDAGVLYFTADDGVHGLEPWRTDGTEMGTAMVADVTVGPDSSRARVVGVDALGQYLSSTSPTTGVWKKNSALPSAVMLHADGVEDGQAIVFGGALLFRGSSTAQGTELWKSTGTPGGTAMLADLAFGNTSSLPGAMVMFNEQVYFTAITIAGTSGQLFRTNGTAAGTAQVTGSWNSRVQSILGTYSGKLMMQVGDTTGRLPSVWLSDGVSTTATSLTSVVLTRPGDLGPYHNFSPALLIDSGALYMLGAPPNMTNFSGPQVFKYPGTGTATQPVTSLAGPGPASVKAYTLVGGRVVMAGEDPIGSATSGGGEVELWAQEAPGSAASARIADLYSGNTGSSLLWLRGSEGRLFFLNRSTSVPSELRVTQGTPGSTVLLGAVNPGVVSNAAGVGPAVLGSTLYFENRVAATGLELWASDGSGTPEGTRLVRDLAPGTADTEFDQLTASGSFMYFRVTQGDGGTAVWRTDGSNAPSGTVMLTPDTGAFSNLTDVDGRLMFVGRATPSDPPGLWISDGSPPPSTGTARVRAFTSLSIGGTPITAVKGTGRAFFASGPLSTEGRELWMSDGTEMGTARVADIVTGPGSSNPTQIVSAGVGASGEPRVLFVAATAGEGAELWFSDGTPPPAGTRLVKDIRTGPTGSGISELVAVVSPAPGTSVRAYFVADDGTGERLWTSDGSEPGTHALLDINPAGADRVGNFAIARGRLYFTADDGVHGLELWTSDGTAMGTRMVADVWPGDRGGLEIIDPGNPTPGPSLTAVNNRLYFIGNDGTHGNELRVLDLCPADFNNDANVSVQDVFDFLGAYFTGNDRADVNGVGGVMVQDVFEFLAAWFGGC